MYAVQNAASTDIIRLFLTEETDVNSRDDQDKTVLMLAAALISIQKSSRSSSRLEQT